MINLGKGSEKASSVHTKSGEEEARKSVPDESASGDDSQRKKNGKENKCKHKRTKEPSEQETPSAEAKAEINSKERGKRHNCDSFHTFEL